MSLLSAWSSSMCWTRKRKPEVWVQSAGHSSQWRSSHHRATNIAPLLIPLHAQSTLCHIQASRGLGACQQHLRTPSGHTGWIGCVDLKQTCCFQIHEPVLFYSEPSSPYPVMFAPFPSTPALPQRAQSPPFSWWHLTIKDYFTARKPWQRPAWTSWLTTNRIWDLALWVGLSYPGHHYFTAGSFQKPHTLNPAATPYYARPL